jgi:hypothetical protein
LWVSRPEAPVARVARVTFAIPQSTDLLFRL